MVAAPPKACIPPQPSIIQPWGWAAVLAGESLTARAMSQFGQKPELRTAPADPNACTPPQPSSVTPETLPAVLPGVSEMSRAMLQFGQKAAFVILGGIGLAPMAKACSPPQPSRT